jgi:chemotaxis protein methyltransferase CheR
VAQISGAMNHLATSSQHTASASAVGHRRAAVGPGVRLQDLMASFHLQPAARPGELRRALTHCSSSGRLPRVAATRTTPMKTLSNKAFESVTQLFHSVSGIRLGEAQAGPGRRAAAALAQEAGEPDVDSYVDKVVRGDTPATEMTRVIDRLTTNETYFFREPQHFADLQSRLARVQGRSSSGSGAPPVRRAKRPTARRWCWPSAGPHALAGDRHRPVDRGRRIGPARAVPAGARAHGAAGLPEALLPQGPGPARGPLLITRELREQGALPEANLMQNLPELPMFDVIFLRNVLIYFDNDAKAQIVRRVLGHLKPDGVLYTGHAESMSALNLPLRPLATAIYGHK